MIQELKYKYEVLIIYNENDSEFVENNLVPNIRSSVDGESFFVTSDSVPVGCSIPEEMTQLMKKSRRVIAIISDHFVSDTWCLLQFTLAMAIANSKLRDPSAKLFGLYIYSYH